MGQFDGMKQGELQRECQDRGLSAAGSNADMIARLDEFVLLVQSTDFSDDDEANVGEPAAAPEPEAEPAAPAAVPAATFVAPPPTAPNALVAGRSTTNPWEFTATFLCYGELSDGLHEEYIRQTHARAIAAGLRPKGGAYRSGWVTVDGQRHAKYAIKVRQ